MEFKEAMRVWKRMCAAHGTCRRCPIAGENAGECRARVTKNPEKYEAILTKWAEEHPERTIADDFLEKHPKATTHSDGTPFVCAKYCGYGEPEICKTASEPCVRCWRRPLEEAK